MKENIIKIENLIFEYVKEESSKVRALDGISLCLERGSFTAVIGQNGSGKSTLAKNMNALMLPSGGRVLVKGMDTADQGLLWDIRQTCGMVFQNPDNQLVSSVVEDDIAFGPENIGIKPEEIRERVDDALESVDMYEFRKKAPHMLSGGQKQRVAIAGVVAMKPECIVFDEPTAMLDPQGRKDVMDIIKLLHEDGITTVLITHFMDEAAQAERIIVMSEGRITLDGTPQEIFRRTDELRKLNMEVPITVQMAQKLREKGIEIPYEITGAGELADYLCQYR